MPATVNSQRHDPYRNFKFKIKWDNQYVAGLSKCSALKKTTEVVDWWEAGDQSAPYKLPGKTSYEAVTLEAGVTHDSTFEEWAARVNTYQGAGASSPPQEEEFRKDITLDVFNLKGELVISYNIFRCWVSEYQALPEMDASGNAIMIQTIKLENEGWTRDSKV